MVQREEIDDIDFSIRFKYGVHTIFLFVDPNSTFSDISSELLGILQNRYPDGLQVDRGMPKTALPEDPSLIEYAVLKSTVDPDQGWRPLKASKEDTAVAKGLRDNLVVAFAFRDTPEEELGEVVFEVAFPTYDDEMAEE